MTPIKRRHASDNDRSVG